MPVLNISSDSEDWRARRLSNFWGDPFVLDGEKFASVEGFIQGIKFSEHNPMRRLCFDAVGKEAKRLGRSAERKYVWWKGEAIPYGSDEHHKLIERVIRAKFEQNKKAMKALLATEEMELTHDLGYPESPKTSLPARVFCDILTRIREEAIRDRK